MSRKLSPTTYYRFSLLRILLGLYLACHFARLIAYSSEIFSSAGVFPSPSFNLSFGYFPSMLYLFGGPSAAITATCIGLALSLLFIWGKGRRWVAFILWYLWACQYHQNNLIHTPAVAYVGWMLLAFTLLPSRREDFDCVAAVKILYWGSWVLLAVGYTLSGFDKIWNSPSWQNGEALALILKTPLAYDNIFTKLYFNLAPALQKALSYFVLFAEISFAPLCLHYRTRSWAWSLMLFIHLGILCTIDFAELSGGMLLFHLFCFDSRWFLPRQRSSKAQLYFDGNCGLCNRFVAFLLIENGEGLFSLKTLSAEELQKNTVLFKIEGQGYQKSMAVLKVLDELGGVWRPISWALHWVPRPLRDLAYDLVARSRYSIFGRVDSCRLG